MDLLLTEDFAAVLKESPRSVERMRSEGTGPPFIKVGRRVLYRPSDVDAWLRQNTFSSTADAKAFKANEAAEAARRHRERQATR